MDGGTGGEEGVEMSVIVPALLHIPREARAEAVRLLQLRLQSGADPFTAWVSIYRFTRGQERYITIHEGLEEFFKEMAELEK